MFCIIFFVCFQVHRPSHFMNFSAIEEGDSIGADRDDSFA